MKKRIGWIDFARAVGMLMIITTHSLVGVYASGIVGKLLFAVNVPIFFVLSGYLFKEKGIIQVIKSGFFNLILPYTFSVVLIALIEQFYYVFPNWINEFSGFPYVWSAIYGLGTPTILPKNMVIPAIGALWFLLAMFWGNILFTIAIKCSKKVNKKGILEMIILLMVIGGFWISNYIKLPWSLNAAMVSQSFYYAGYMIKKHNLIEDIKPMYIILGLILWILSAQSGFFYLNVPFADNIFLAVLGGIGGSYFVMIISKLITTTISTKHIDYYGKMSLIVLSFHLIDLNATKLGLVIMNRVYMLTHSDGMVIIGLVIYHVLITIFAVIIIPKLPIIRSFYLNRSYPFSARR